MRSPFPTNCLNPILFVNNHSARFSALAADASYNTPLTLFNWS
jgi:hypothetical protein